jgi:hypothetical protein
VTAFQEPRTQISDWAKYRFGLFLEERGLEHHFEHIRSGQLDLPLPGSGGSVGQSMTFEKYDFVSSRGKSWPSQRNVYHGTYAEGVARISWTEQFKASDHADLGHECRTSFPAVFSANTIEHAIRYAWPSNFLQDNLYYGVLFQLAIDESQILQERRGEVLIPPHAIFIKSLFLLTNMAVAQGGPKHPVRDPSLELLPSSMVDSQGTLLTPNFARHTNWHNN